MQLISYTETLDSFINKKADKYDIVQLLWCRITMRTSYGVLSHSGTCVRARVSDPSLSCDDDGNFEPLQCRQTNNQMYSCQCVDPVNPVQHYNVRQYEVRTLSDVPDCDDLGMSHLC